MKFYLNILFLVTLFNIHSASAQWQSHVINSPVQHGQYIKKIATNNSGDTLWALATLIPDEFYLWQYTETSGWVSMPSPAFAPNEDIYSAKWRNNILWCLSSQHLSKFENNAWQNIPLPTGYIIGQTLDGLYVDNENVWFAGGPQGKGITKYNGVSWVNYNRTNAHFPQDIGITDISMNEKDSIIWVSTNCFGDSSGVYSFDIKNNTWTVYDNKEPKYRCVHGVVPLKNKTIVGTCNYSSIRVLNNNGQFTQSLEGYGGVDCVEAMEADPDNEDMAWVMTDYKLFHFNDTLDYEYIDTSNTLMKWPFLTSIAVSKYHHDSSRVWITTPTGVYSYTYKSQQTTGIDESQQELNHISIYPNPGNGLYTLSIPGNVLPVFTVFNLNGQPVDYRLTKDSDKYMIDISDLSAGIYFLAVSNGTSKVFRKLILTE